MNDVLFRLLLVLCIDFIDSAVLLVADYLTFISDSNFYEFSVIISYSLQRILSSFFVGELFTEILISSVEISYFLESIEFFCSTGCCSKYSFEFTCFG